MKQKAMGFIGGGPVVRVLLGGFQRAGAVPTDCVVADAKPEVLEALAQRFPGIRAVGADITESAQQEMVFGALHAPVLFLVPVRGAREARQQFRSCSRNRRARPLPHAARGGRCLLRTRLSATEMMDLIPVKPLEAAESTLRERYRSALTGLHGKHIAH